MIHVGPRLMVPGQESSWFWRDCLPCPSRLLGFCTGSSLPPSHAHSLWLRVVSEAPLPSFSQAPVTGTIARLTLSYHISFNRAATQGGWLLGQE